MTIAREKMSVSFLNLPPFRTSGADHCTPLTRWGVSSGGSRDVAFCSSGINVIRLRPARQARPSLLIKMLDLGTGSVICGRRTMNVATYPVEVSVNYSLTMHVNQPLGDIRKL